MFRDRLPSSSKVPPDLRRNSSFGYPAFGVYLKSDLPVPGLVEFANPGLPEVSLSMGREPAGFDARRYVGVWYESWYKARSGEPFVAILTAPSAVPGQLSFWLKYADGTNIFFDGGLTAIAVTWAPSSSVEDAATYLLGPAMAVFAQLRGFTCLHGSAVAVDGVTIGLLGAQGAGKSTSAAAFAAAGCAVVADDLILLVESGDGFLVEPTYPVVRLWPSSVELLFGCEDALPRLIPNWDKRGLHLNENEDNYRFQREPLPLAALYLLGERSEDDAAPHLAPVSGTAALMRLVSNSWGHYADKPAILASQLRLLTRVSQTIPIRQLIAHRDPARLPQMCQLLIDDIRSISRADNRTRRELIGTGINQDRN